MSLALYKEKKQEKKQEQNIARSSILVKLLRGAVTSDEKKYWEALLIHQEAVREYFSALNLKLLLNIDDGYAFLQQRYLKNHFEEGEKNEEGNIESDFSDIKDNAEENTHLSIPNLVHRIPLSFEVSFLCVLLREALEQFDSKVNDDHRLVLHRADIYDLLKLFYEEKNDETKQTKRFDSMINRVLELGFLKELKNQDSFEVRRIIKAQFDAEKLVEIKARMLSAIRQYS